MNNIHEQNVQHGQGSIANNVLHLEMKFDSEAAAYDLEWLSWPNKASETHETYTFLSKVYEESNKIIDDMLAKKYVDGGESGGMVHVSISIANDEIDNVDTVGMAKGIANRESSRKQKKRYKSWIEKKAKKTTMCSKRKRSGENLVQSLPVSSFYQCIKF